MRGNNNSDKTNAISTYQKLYIPVHPIFDRLKSCYFYRYLDLNSVSLSF